jgi:RNA polymerase sigma-70 factor (ECF subfamily)
MSSQAPDPSGPLAKTATAERRVRRRRPPSSAIRTDDSIEFLSPVVASGGIVGVVGVTVEEAYRKWGDELVGYATALVGPADAPDLVSEAFAAVLVRGDAFWSTVATPRAYLFRSITNAARMSARSRLRRRARELRWSAHPVAGELLFDPAVRRALDRLSVQQRAVIYLAYWHDLAPEAIGGLLDISDGAVRRHLARARSRLRKVLA